MNSLIPPKLELIQEFMAALVTCKFEDPIKIEGTIDRTMSNMLLFFFYSKASNFEVDSPIWPEFELIQNFMTVLVSCKIDEDRIGSSYHPDNIFSIISLWKKFSSLMGE